MATGWVKIHRKMMESSGYFAEAFCRNMAWVDLIILANHDENFFRARGIKVTVKRGQVGYGLDELARRWKWSRGKVERFFCEMEKDGRIIRQKTNVTTLISIVNYSQYQENDNANSKADNKANSKADGQQTVKQTETNKNDNNEENDKNEKNNGASAKLAKNSKLFKPEIVFPWKSSAFSDAWRRWRDYREKQFRIKFKSEDAEQSALNDLKKLAGGSEVTAIEIIDQSIKKTWRGLFELKVSNGSFSNVAQSPGQPVVIKSFADDLQYIVDRYSEGELDDRLLTPELYKKMEEKKLIPEGYREKFSASTPDLQKALAIKAWLEKNKKQMV